MQTGSQSGPVTLPQLKGQMFIADGGIETHLIFNKGQEVPHFCAFVLNDRESYRQTLIDYYRAYLPIAKRAGQGFIFDTNTWRANPDWGRLVGYDAEALKQSNMGAIALCREVQKEFSAAGVPSLVSGVVGPRRDGWQYDTIMSVAEAYDYHRVQIAAFGGAGADYVTALTLTNTPEAIGIVKAAQWVGLPSVISFTLETDGRLPGGKALGAAITEVDLATDNAPAYYMINCVHPIHFAETVRHGGQWVNRIGGLRVNASMKSHAELDESETLDIGDWNDLAQRYDRLLPFLPNIRVIGGCCGTDHRHIDAICRTCLPAASASAAA